MFGAFSSGDSCLTLLNGSDEVGKHSRSPPSPPQKKDTHTHTERTKSAKVQRNGGKHHAPCPATDSQTASAQFAFVVPDLPVFRRNLLCFVIHLPQASTHKNVAQAAMQCTCSQTIAKKGCNSIHRKLAVMRLPEYRSLSCWRYLSLKSSTR